MRVYSSEVSAQYKKKKINTVQTILPHENVPVRYSITYANELSPRGRPTLYLSIEGSSALPTFFQTRLAIQKPIIEIQGMDETESSDPGPGSSDGISIQDIIKNTLAEHLCFDSEATSQPPKQPRGKGKGGRGESQAQLDVAELTNHIIMKVLPVIVDTVATAVDKAVTAVVQRLTESLDTKGTQSKMQRQALMAKYDTDRLEQYTRRETIRISGLPEEEGEDVIGKVVDLGKKIGVDLDTKDISVVHRNGRKIQGQHRQILCRFVSRASADKLHAKRSHLKDFAEYRSKVFINEDLTPLRSRMLGYAKSVPGVKRVSSKNGRIFCNMENDKLVILDTPDDMFKLGLESIDYTALLWQKEASDIPSKFELLMFS